MWPLFEWGAVAGVVGVLIFLLGPPFVAIGKKYLDFWSKK